MATPIEEYWAAQDALAENTKRENKADVGLTRGVETPEYLDLNHAATTAYNRLSRKDKAKVAIGLRH